jgi:hypothetical protein
MVSPFVVLGYLPYLTIDDEIKCSARSIFVSKDKSILRKLKK